MFVISVPSVSVPLTLVVIMISIVVPLLMFSVQLICCPLIIVGVRFALTYVVPVGSVSVILTFVAFPAPELVMFSV